MLVKLQALDPTICLRAGQALIIESMARPPRCRYVTGIPAAGYFKPRGIPVAELDEVVLTIDEFEAIRLADFDQLYQETAAARMKVSRPTFGRIIAAARRKIADALVGGKALRIEGGHYETPRLRRFACTDCRHQWQLASGTGRPRGCPACGGANFLRDKQNQPAT